MSVPAIIVRLFVQARPSFVYACYSLLLSRALEMLYGGDVWMCRAQVPLFVRLRCPRGLNTGQQADVMSRSYLLLTTYC